MLSAEGCRARRIRFWDELGTAAPGDRLLLADPLNLIYLANFHVDPFSLGADFGGLLELTRDGEATLWHDNRLPKSVELSMVDRRQVVTWYDGQTPGRGPRRLALASGRPAEFRIHDRLGDPAAPAIHEAIARLRRRKDADEIALLKKCMRAGEAGFSWSRRHVRPGMTELEVYAGIASACTLAAGQAVIVYGDFAVSPGPERRGGPPTARILQAGDMMILDYSVILHGYRSDFTNTLVVGGSPNPQQQRLYDQCMAAMEAGEQALRAGALCQTVDDAVRGAFAAAGVAEHFPHHVGHGLGLSHPEAPFIVRHSTETLLAGDVITLEPGLYVSGVGGIRIEHNYLITDTGFERLSHHEITLV